MSDSRRPSREVRSPAAGCQETGVRSEGGGSHRPAPVLFPPGHGPVALTSRATPLDPISATTESLTLNADRVACWPFRLISVPGPVWTVVDPPDVATVTVPAEVLTADT